MASTAKPSTGGTEAESAPPALSARTLPDLPLGLLGSLELETPLHRYAEQWTRVLGRVEHERALYEFCAWPSAACPPALTRWRAQLAHIANLPPRAQLRLINRGVNALIPYASDEEAHGEADYWASPLESIQSGGDCEDYAILKFFSLLELGFTDDQLRLVVVRDRQRGGLHAVLVVQLEGRTYVLDTHHAEPIEHQRMLHYVPVYSANLGAQWVHLVTSEIRGRFLAEPTS
jgi:predicted transglutaminase-like cysteine proteinase